MPRHNKTIKHTPIIISYNCTPKRKFPNEYQATEAAEYQMLINPTLQLSTYQCEVCHKWHLTRLLK